MVEQADIAGLIRERRRALGLTLQDLADAAGCTKGYLSLVENRLRANPPGPSILAALEARLGLAPGCLIAAAQWHATPPLVKREVGRLEERSHAAARLAQIMGGTRLEPDGRVRGTLDEAYRSGELQRLIERVSPAEASAPVRASLPVEVPLINRVAAGYPREFTDLGYPARVADEYIRSPDVRDPDAFAARVVGDSMEPDYREGDIVVFSPARAVKSGMDCFARLEPDHETTFKRVFLERDEEGEEVIRLQPLNERYPARVLARECVAGLYPAVSVTRSLVG